VRRLRDLARPDQPAPNLGDYEEARSDFSWAEADALLDGLPDGRGLNIAHEVVDRHLDGPRAERVALRWLGRSGERRDLTYRDLAEATSRFANVLHDLEVGSGEVLFTLLGRIPELYVAVLGALKAKVVVSPLFSAFGPEPVRQRVELGSGRVLVTTVSLYRRRVEPVRDQLPTLEHVLLLTDTETLPPRTLSLRPLMDDASPTFDIPPTDPSSWLARSARSPTTT
jgi:acetyl-CoA synthetase